MVEHILYINLDHRTDRKQRMEIVLENFSYERIQAIHTKKGFIGSSKSHIRALEYAISKNWNHVLIMEDDMEWNDFDKNYPKLLELMKNPYDVIVLGGILVSHNSETSKLYQCNSTGAYLVSKHYYQTLLNNFKDGMNKMIYEINTSAWGIKEKSVHKYLIDTYWHQLQSRDNWFIVPLCYSDEGYSDVLYQTVNWQPYFLK
jgi:hypothetical protein